MDAETAKKNETRDLERLAEAIARVERRSRRYAAEGDQGMARFVDRDVRALQALAGAVKAGDYRRAKTIAWRMDTAVCDLIPNRLYNAIFPER